MNRIEWKPCESVGPLKFGTHVKPYVDLDILSLIDTPPDKTGWLSYQFNGDDFRVHSEDGKIVSVACYSECFLSGINLIGISLPSFEKLIGAVPSEGPDVFEVSGEIQEVYEFDSYGAQVWVSDGIVVTIFCND